MAEVEVVPQASGSQSDDVSYMLDIKNHSDRFSDDDSDGSAYSSVCSKDDYSPTPSSAESVTSSSPLLHREPPAGFETLHSDVRDPSLLDRQDKPREGVAIEAQSKLSLDMTMRSPLSPKLSGNKLPPGEGDCEDDLPDWLLARTTLSPPASTIKRSARSPQQIEDEIRFAVDSAAARVQQELGRREQFNSELQSAAMWSPTQTTADKQSATSKLFSSSGNDSERRAHVSNDLFDVQGEKEMLSIADHVVASDAEQGDLLLLMEVVIGDGRAETIEIHEGDNPDALALAFVQKHALESDSVPKLRNLIQEQLHALAEAEPDETLQSELVVEDEWTIDAEFDQYARVQRQEREEEYFKQFPFKPDIGVNALWVAPDKSQSDFVERLAVDKYHELERKRVALHDKYAPDRDPRTGKELFKPETGRAPAFSRNKQGLPIGDFLHAAHREQQEYHRQLREKDKREIKKKSQQTFYANHTPISRDAFSGYIDRLVREVPGVTYSQIIFLAEHLQTEKGGRHRHQFHHSDPEREAALAAAEQKELTFHPVIDKNSREIATKHGRVSGSKVFEALNQYYDHYLERKEQLRKQQQREFKKSHPFHPTLITKTHQREPAATAFYDKIRMGNCEDAGNTVSWGATASVSSAPASNRNVGASIPPPVPLQTALSNARPCIRPIENERSRFYTAATADEPQLEETTRSISRSSSSSQLEDAELTSRVLAALDEKPASTSPTSSYHLTKALSVNDDSTSSADKVCSVRSPEDSALNAANYEFADM
ncbi:hypothetical protein JG688_00001401 [Phytophthora aleatoria]|uniref:Uncharacterized protein n=1 Tax=Phytophthora aleatoria TaxID=2496075 RepID=A0A8J5J6D7_9STRA|nr:hypothetical protein JG688_00001401 [Phytophthora aleatoria]